MSCLFLSHFGSQAAIVSKIVNVFTFPYVQAFVSKTDLAIKLIKVILGPSFEQTTMVWSLQILHTKFRENRSTGSGEEYFEHFEH